jgi:hypothetical protein
VTEQRHAIVAALAGMRFPARRWQLIAWADYNCASLSTRDLLSRLSEVTIYRDLGHVLAHAHKLVTDLDTEAR